MYCANAGRRVLSTTRKPRRGSPYRHCCSTRTRVEFGGKNRRSQVFFRKMIQNTGRQVRSDEEKNNGQ